MISTWRRSQRSLRATRSDVVTLGQVYSDVLVRVSGRVDIVEHPLVAAALRTPENYYTEFSYQTIESGGVMRAFGPYPQKMQIRFEPSLISDLLRLAGLPVWGSNRPSVLFGWLAVPEQSERSLGKAVRAYLLNR